MPSCGASTGPLPPGQYDVKVTSVEYKEPNIGTAMYRIELTVEVGLHKGRRVWTHLVWKPESPSGVGYFFGQLRGLGLDSGSFAELSTEAAEQSICQALVRRRAHITVGHLECNAMTEDEIGQLAPAGKRAAVGASVVSPRVPTAPVVVLAELPAAPKATVR